jgi:hypothetical protein
MSCSIQDCRCASCSRRASTRGSEPFKTERSYIHLRIIPFVHAQGLDLGYVCPQLAMQRCASHTQEDAQLQYMSVAFAVETSSRPRRRMAQAPCYGRDLRSNSPILYSLVSIRPNNMCAFYLPGFLAPQSAQVPFPGTVFIKSCSARSLRAC